MYPEDTHFILCFNSGVRFKVNEDIYKELAYGLPGYLACRKLRRGDTVVDCGAYVGGFTLYAAQIVGSEGKVICFEPDYESYKKLLDNIKINNFTNVIAINKGIWSCDRTLKFSTGHSSESSIVTNNVEPFNEVQVVSLDNELKRRGIEKVDFIKMDIEGAEIEAVKGCKATIDKGTNFVLHLIMLSKEKKHFGNWRVSFAA
ncbi:MAG: FkbM family methyltransferase [Dehalococcoidales bacterium]|nr:FkbM family methyltransferase [Dehalococcoidales bacterium]